MGISGYVVLGIVTLFLVYLMPQLIRSRQEVLDSRLTDRFSADLRILATAGVPGSSARLLTDDAPRVYLLDPRLRTDVSAMNRPSSLAAPTSASTPGRQQPAARGRRGAARRRLLLTSALFVASASTWFAVATGTAHSALAAVPTVLLLLVLVMGRRAAAASSRAARSSVPPAGDVARSRPSVAVPDARRPAPGPRSTEVHARGATSRRPRGVASSAASRGAAGSGLRDAQTEIFPRLPAAQLSRTDAFAGASRAVASTEAGSSPTPTNASESIGGTATHATTEGSRQASREVSAPAEPGQRATARAGREVPPADTSRSWTPVPVPVPTYTLKPPAPRTSRTPFAAAAGTVEPTSAPLVEAAPAATTDAPAAMGDVAPASDDADRPQRASADGSAENTSVGATPPPSRLDLDAVLTRRRASGE